MESALADAFRSPDGHSQALSGAAAGAGAACACPNLSDQVQVLQEEIAIQESLIQMYQKADQRSDTSRQKPGEGQGFLLGVSLAW